MFLVFDKIDRGELKKEIIVHSKKMSLDLNDEQVKNKKHKKIKL